MTDSVHGQRPGKRERLVASAADLFHRHGVQQTTLAEVAQAAQVPPGNVYYYFKTRDELIGAVIEEQRSELDALLERLDAHPTPVERLQGLAETWAQNSTVMVEGGCPMGGLSQELSKSNPAQAERAMTCLSALLEWAERQFGELGVEDPGADAFTLIASIQGAALLANGLGDESLVRREIARLQAWIQTRA